jgi:hypothetical protein
MGTSKRTRPGPPSGNGAICPAFPPEVVIRTLGRDYDSGDFLHTAAVVLGLDLVISADTSVVHPAGTLGRPVWVALGAVPD